MKHLRLAALISASFVLPAATARAADDGPIVVTGRGLDPAPATPAYGVVEIPQDQIVQAASGRIEDVLSSVAGFQQFRRSDSRSSNPSAQGVTLRALGGNATSRSLVLLDGVPMADPFFGYIPLSAIAPERIGSIRVTRGGGSGAFGAGAVAGTIELTSASPEQAGGASASLLASGRGDTEMSGSIAPRLGGGLLVASGRWDRGKGFWTTPAFQRVPASVRSAYDSWSASVRAVAPIGGAVELQARLLAFDDRRVLRFAGADTAHSGQDASLRLVGRGAWQFDVLGYVQVRDFSNVVISSTNFRKTLDQRRTPSTGLGGKVELRPPVGGGHTLRLGADFRHAEGDLQEEAYSTATGLVTARRRAGGRNGDLGLFVEDDWALGDLVLTAGLRADRWTVTDGYFREAGVTGVVTTDNRFADRQGWDTSWRGGAMWKVAGGLSLRVAGYTGLRLPTLNELYRPFTVFPVTTRANAALRNERLRGFEGGIDVNAGDHASLSLTAFDNRVRDAIANVTTGTNLRERRNIDMLESRGIELGGRVRLGTVEMDGSLAWTRARIRDDTPPIAGGKSLNGKQPAQTPRLAASATVAWHPREGAVLSATLRHLGAQFEDDLETDLLPAATTVGLFAQWPVAPRFSVVLRAENLTGERIVTRNQSGSLDYGAPRTLWAGLKVGL